jgi:hypothetical protein
MRRGGRPITRRLHGPWRVETNLRARSWGLDGGLLGKAAAAVPGVVLSVSLAWTGRLLAMVVIGWEVWQLLSFHQRMEVCMSFFKRPDATVGGGGKGSGKVEDKDFAKEAPTLLAYLQEDAWPDGQDRQRSSIVLFVEDGMLKACLSEKDTSSTLWASSRNFWGILEALEGRLTEDAPDWRKSKPRKK